MPSIPLLAGHLAGTLVIGLAAILLATRARDFTPLRLLAAGTITALAALAMLLVQRSADPRPLLWVVLFQLAAIGPLLCTTPLVIRLCGRRGVRLPAASIVLCALGFVPSVVLAYATLVQPRLIVIERTSIGAGDRFPSGAEPITIAVVADIQTPRITEHEQRTLRAVADLSPDLIIIPGDLFQPGGPGVNWQQAIDREAGDFRALLDGYAAIAPAVFTPGNCEFVYNDRALIESTGVVYLTGGQIGEFTIRGRRVLIAGAGYTIHNSQQAERILAALEEARADDPAAISLIAAHTPDAMLALPAADPRVDLVIAGHTHGGQVAIPFVGPILNNTRLPGRVAGGGLHTHNRNAIYVSRGVGLERGGAPPIRLFAPPEISLITFSGSHGASN